MALSCWYKRLKDILIYNIHYAPNYPYEDYTNLYKEFGQIEEYLDNVKNGVKSDYKITQLNFAKVKIKDAFLKYESGNNGRVLLEEALRYVEDSKRAKPPATNFIAGSNGIVKLNKESENE
ncbi:hypothetical protein [Clostridium omnivorum]|uniref:Uncharacterized protein n=1 Tax=Clostridium omnivorum TaxID=1604902 RepID=A0ABQ5N8V8_9CLOT|nr:hypothetical protein [Clostridium sp. E14]GLC31551.1 hypothetical protein bsdE14_29610 [Clostridium sp. E14]